MLLLSSCGFSGNRQGEDAAEQQPAEGTEDALLGYSTRKEDVYYVDKEYGFIYEKKSSASGNVGVSYQDKSHFRVTAFTDKP
jgi:hypothetical protein